jgi:hypothetical protein
VARAAPAVSDGGRRGERGAEDVVERGIALGPQWSLTWVNTIKAARARCQAFFPWYCLRLLALRSTVPRTLEARPEERRAAVYQVDITADLNDEDETGDVRTFLDEARDSGRITPGVLVVAGDQEAAAACQVVDLVPAGDATIVHLRLLPGLVDEHRALVDRALAS